MRISSSLSVLFAALNIGIVLGQGTNTSVICFQPLPQDSPNATVLTNFVNGSINAACNYFNQPAVVGPLVYNLTGYSFAKLNIDLLAPNLTECQQAFSSIITGCIQSFSSPSYGGVWSPQLALSYFLTDVAYPANPIEEIQPPPTTASSSTAMNTGTMTSSSTSVTTTAPPTGPGSDGQDVIDAVAVAAAAAAAFLALSWMGPLAELEATAALVAVRDATTGMPLFFGGEASVEGVKPRCSVKIIKNIVAS